MRNGYKFGRLKANGANGRVQVEELDGEVHSEMFQFQPHGLESKAPTESATFSAYSDGNPDNGAILVINGRSSITLDDGDTVLYSAGGATVHCTGAKIELNGDTFGGLIKIDELTTKINDLVTAYNSHSHVGLSPLALPTVTMTALNAADYENEDVNHG